MPSPSDLPVIDWSVAVRLAGVMAGPGPATTREERDAFRRDVADVTARSEGLVRAFTGLEPPDAPPAPLVVDRKAWVRANVEGLEQLVRPLAEKLAATPAGSGIARRVASAALGAQVGVLLGYLSQKVLGQYDLVLATEGGPGRLYFVGPNMIELERKYHLPERDFRFWVALHEVTHRVQFTGVPWLRARVRGMIERSLSSLNVDPAQVKAIVDRGKDLLAQGPAAWRRANVMELVLSEEQQALLQDVQALMSVVEGHAMFVMNRIGAHEIPELARLRSVLDARRRSTKGAEKAFQRALGIEMKLQQYTLGESFCVAVAERAGDDAVNKLWERDGDNMPTLEEMRDPERWLARVGV